MSDDDELEKLKEERMKQRQQQQGGENQVNPEEQMEQRRQQIKQQAAQYLTKKAKSRLGNIRAADPDLAASIEMQIVQLGRTGQIDEVTDDELKDILRSIQSEKDQNQTDIKFRR